ncbi:MAG: adenylosuccinate lyase, partial [Solirubrobacteraceae bacterium]
LILIDYMQHLATRMAAGMVVHGDRMLENLGLTYGALFSQRALLALIDTGLQRDEAYRVVQELAQRAWDTRVPLRQLIEERPELGVDVDKVFDLEHGARYAQEIVGRLDGA